MFLYFVLLVCAFFHNSAHCSEKPIKKNVFGIETLKGLKAKTSRPVFEFSTEHLVKLSYVPYSERNFHLFVLFNALDEETNCQACVAVAEIYAKFADIFQKRAGKSSLPSFFSTIELKDNMEAFKMVELDHVPVIMHFGPKSNKPTKFENSNLNDPHALLNFMLTQTGSQMNVESVMNRQQSQYSKPMIFLAVMTVIAGLIYCGVVSASSVFFNPIIWSLLSIGFIIIMLSGHMWVKIRNPPYMGPNKLYVMKSSPQAQFGVESKLVAALTAAVTAIVLLVVPITYKFDDVNKRRIAAMILSLMYMAAHSGLLKIFAMKFPGYPLSYIF